MKASDTLFETGDESFSFDAYGVTLTVKRLPIQGSVVFQVSFSSGRSTLVITRAQGAKVPYFWTSLPEGRQKEAEGVGKLITEYLENLI